MPIGQYLITLTPGPLTWTAADQLATQLGGQLASLSTLAENQRIVDVLNGNPIFFVQGNGQGYGPWIGLVQDTGSAEPNSGWRWLDGSAFDPFGWHPTQPDNFVGDNVGAFLAWQGTTGWGDNVDDPAATGRFPASRSAVIEFGVRQTEINGTAGVDYALAGAANNTLRGFAGEDTLDGGLGADTLDGGEGIDRLVGGRGSDTYYATSGDTVVEAGERGSFDQVFASGSLGLTDTAEVEVLATTDGLGTAAIDLLGSNTAQLIQGNNGVNRLEGRLGNDTLVGFGGADTLDGGAGSDTYEADEGDVIVEVAERGSQDRVNADAITLSASAEVEFLVAYAGTQGGTLTGSDTNNEIVGNEGINVLNGRGGADELFGNGGADVLAGGLGRDTLDGGADASRDRFVFADAVGTANLDVVRNLDARGDRDLIVLDNDVFRGLPLPAGEASRSLTSVEFEVDATGTTYNDLFNDAGYNASDRIIYQAQTGRLYYDRDGEGGAAAIRFAELDPNLALRATDFLIIE